MNGHSEPLLSVTNDCFFGGSKMGELLRFFDWSKTPIGDVATWSPAFRMMVRILLANRFPMVLWRGPHYYQLYNDSYRPMLGTVQEITSQVLGERRGLALRELGSRSGEAKTDEACRIAAR